MFNGACCSVATLPRCGHPTAGSWRPCSLPLCLSPRTSRWVGPGKYQHPHPLLSHMMKIADMPSVDKSRMTTTAEHIFYKYFMGSPPSVSPTWPLPPSLASPLSVSFQMSGPKAARLSHCPQCSIPLLSFRGFSCVFLGVQFSHFCHFLYWCSSKQFFAVQPSFQFRAWFLSKKAIFIHFRFRPRQPLRRRLQGRGFVCSGWAFNPPTAGGGEGTSQVHSLGSAK